MLRNAGVLLVALAAAGGIVYARGASMRVGIPDATVSAPQVDVSPAASGVLRAVYVRTGDVVAPNAVVAEVGTQLLTAAGGGLVVSVNRQIGATFSPGQAVVALIDPSQLRVVGQADENKGLNRLRVGQAADFTADAFGSRVFHGVVDEVSPTAQASGVVFNISDQRQTQIFDVKVRFDASAYPELKNGMSARLTVYTE